MHKLVPSYFLFLVFFIFFLKINTAMNKLRDVLNYLQNPLFLMDHSGKIGRQLIQKGSGKGFRMSTCDITVFVYFCKPGILRILRFKSEYHFLTKSIRNSLTRLRLGRVIEFSSRAIQTAQFPHFLPAADWVYPHLDLATNMVRLMFSSRSWIILYLFS